MALGRKFKDSTMFEKGANSILEEETTPNVDQVFYHSLHSCFGVRDEYGGHLGLMEREDVVKEMSVDGCPLLGNTIEVPRGDIRVYMKVGVERHGVWLASEDAYGMINTSWANGMGDLRPLLPTVISYDLD